MKVLKSSPSATPKKRAVKDKRDDHAEQKPKASSSAASRPASSDDASFRMAPSVKRAKMESKADSDVLMSEPVGHGHGRGLLEGQLPADVSARDLADIVKKAKNATELFGDLSAAETIEKIFEWFGRPSIDLPWFYKNGSSLERTIVPSEHNRELQDQSPISNHKSQAGQ